MRNRVFKLVSGGISVIFLGKAMGASGGEATAGVFALDFLALGAGA
jgi:hypothetical protein